MCFHLASASVSLATTPFISTTNCNGSPLESSVDHCRRCSSRVEAGSRSQNSARWPAAW